MSDEARLIVFLWTGLLGLLVGSFLNVCIFRLPRNCMSVVRPRSKCPSCRSLIAWYDNIPVFSWIALGGKCRHCAVRISPRYAGVELLTAALYLFASWRIFYGPGAGLGPPDQAALFVLHAWFLGALIVSTFIDLEFRILPDEITLPGVVIGLAFSAAFPSLLHVGDLVRVQSWNPRLASLAAGAVGALLGGGAIYGVGVLGKLVFRKEAMGFGDVKFMAMVGAVLGARGVLLTFVLACLLGSVFGIGKRIVTGTMGYVPFGPFLSAGALVMLFFSGLVDRGIQGYIEFVRGLVR
jgi:leader peptidase (prepilin peptidase)/N-methyltransferase